MKKRWEKFLAIAENKSTVKSKAESVATSFSEEYRVNNHLVLMPADVVNKSLNIFVPVIVCGIDPLIDT